MRSDSVHCEEVAELLPGVIDGTHRADRRIRKHVESCLRCQAELVQYRKLLRTIEDVYGLPALGRAKARSPLSKIWTTSPIPRSRRHGR